MESAAVQALLDKIEEAFEAEDADSAATYCQELLDLDPENVDARMYLADLALEDGAFDEVLELGSEVLERDPHNDEIRLMMAEAHLALDNAEEAVTVCDELLRKNPDNLDARYCLAEALLELGAANQAADLYESIVDEQPENVGALLGLGVALYEGCQFELAKQSLQEALELEPELADAWFHLGLVEEWLGKPTEAQKHFKKAHRLDEAAYPVPLKISDKELDGLAREVLQGLPERFREALKNVVISVEDKPSLVELKASDPPLSPNLWGLFRGQTVAEQNGTGGSGTLPSEIVLFKTNLQRGVSSREELIEEVKTTLLHEIGHFLGMDEEEVAAVGLE